ncbi:hypothetical protein AVEN_97035-1 [Araneus ventricosus]|uniref:Uncharacterized protein n=1 Tax=Araneus ventricosus TaxID=182803 RepID=A0A4Y2QZL7_ARAVE|nr:hypothetical protein AVEN_97035-1 [Araneus ventricosus]
MWEFLETNWPTNKPNWPLHPVNADHYIFSCSLTKEFHLIKPADEHKKAWFNNLLTNKQAGTKMEGAFRTSRNICDTLTQERDITDSNDVLRVRVTSILSY